MSFGCSLPMTTKHTLSARTTDNTPCPSYDSRIIGALIKTIASKDANGIVPILSLVNMLQSMTENVLTRYLLVSLLSSLLT